MSPKVLCQCSFFYLMDDATFLGDPRSRLIGVALPPGLQQLAAKVPYIFDGTFFGGIRRSKRSIGVLDHVQHPQYLRLQARVTTGSPQDLFGLVEINASLRFHGSPPSNGLATTYGLSPHYFRRLRIYPSFYSFAQQGNHHFCLHPALSSSSLISDSA
jgi:hypothetical protein